MRKHLVHFRFYHILDIERHPLIFYRWTRKVTQTDKMLIGWINLKMLLGQKDKLREGDELESPKLLYNLLHTSNCHYLLNLLVGCFLRRTSRTYQVSQLLPVSEVMEFSSSNDINTARRRKNDKKLKQLEVCRSDREHKWNQLKHC